MTDMPSIFRRTITVRPLGGAPANLNSSIHLVGAFPEGGPTKTARLYFREFSFPNMQLPKIFPGTLWSRNIAGAWIFSVLLEEESYFKSPFNEHTKPIPTDQTELELFSGRNVMMGTSNGESVTVWRDWLTWHRNHQAADAALIIDRGTPAKVDARASEFAAILQSDNSATSELGAMIIVVLAFDQPLGNPDMGHEAHPLNAPDAPGKDRMEKPTPDPWHAPLSYRLLYDLVHWQFLKKASGVANLNVNELITARNNDVSVFEAAKRASSGAIALRGKRAYPWSLKRAVEPSFGDHICTRFDDLSHEKRWCVAPRKLPCEAIWMPTRILGAKAELADFGFWRFMALRHCKSSGSGVGQIVPKSSLVENEDLLAIAQAFKADPKRQPEFEVSQPNHQRRKDSSSNSVTIVTTMKNEGPFILEWIAYHRAIGAQDFLIYTNDCSDGTDDLLKLLDKKGFCNWRENPYKKTKMKPQHAALQAAGKEQVVNQADWLICMDVDEYIAIHTGDGTLTALFDTVPEANMFSFTWRLFGNNDIDAFQDGFITQHFTSAARELANKPHVAWGFKTLFRNNGNFKKMGVHRPKGIQPKAVERIYWVNGSGEPMPRDQWRNAWRSNKATYGYKLAALNHYAVRSTESFLVKRDRGRVNHVDRDQGLAYWFRMNHNVVKDDRIHRMLPKLTAEYDALLADPEIRTSHEACVEAHRRKIVTLKKQPEYKAFFKVLVSERMRKLSRLHGHFGTNVYLSGPSVIPDEVVDCEPDEEFFFTVEHIGEAKH